nr:efflux RND transporter permease subunit [uncultured Treponema sp.]
MINKWYVSSKLPVLMFLSITMLLLYLGRNINERGSNFNSSSYCSIEVVYPGMDSSFLEKEITIPLENKLSSLKGIAEIKSLSEDSKCSIELLFDIGIDMKKTYIYISNLIDDFYSTIRFPIKKPSIYFYDSNNSSDFMIAFYNNTENNGLEKKIKDDFVPLMEGLPEVARVVVIGNYNTEINISFNYDAVSRRNVTPEDLSNVIQKMNPQEKRVLYNSQSIAETLKISSIAKDISKYENFFINENGQFIPFTELVSVKQSKKKSDDIVKLNGKECIELEIKVFEQANKIKTSKQIKKELDKYFAPDEYAILNDPGEKLYEDISCIAIALVESLILVVIFIPFIFNGMTAIISIVFFIPSVLLWTIFLLSSFKIPINNYSIAGISISLGLIIDPVLVISEEKMNSLSNEHFLSKMPGIIASLSASAGTNLIVFLPFLYIVKLIPSLNAVIESFIVMSAVSFFMAIVFFPCFLIKLKETKPSINNFLSIKKKHKYGIIKKRACAIYMAMVINSLFFLLFFETDSSFSFDVDVITANIEYNPERKKEFIDDSLKNLVDELVKEKGILNTLTICRKGNCQASIKYDKKILSSNEVGKLISKIKKLVVDGYMFIDDGLYEKKGSSNISISIEGQNPVTCRQIAERAAIKLKEIPDVNEVVLNFKSSAQYIELIPNYEIFRFYDLWPYDVCQNLYLYLNAPVIGKFWNKGIEHDVTLHDESYNSVEANEFPEKKIFFNSKCFKINDFFYINKSNESEKLYRKNNRACSYFTVYLKGSKMMEIKQKIQEAMKTVDLDENYIYSFDKKTMEFEENYRTIVFSFITSVILLFILLCILNENLIISLLMVSIIPASYFIPLFIKLFSDPCLGIGDFIGMAISAGIVINNAILIESADLENSRRSIFATNVTTILGAIPVLWTENAGYIKDLSFHMMFSSVAALVISFFIFPNIISGRTSAHKCSLQVQ